MIKQIINYRPDLKQKAHKLRQSGILAEVVLWNNLKSGQLLNYRFRRQKPFGVYIVDFYCPKLKLVIEIDGYSHEDKVKYDQKRDKYLKELGLQILHFRDKDILNKTKEVVYGLQVWIENHMANTPQPPLRGECE